MRLDLVLRFGLLAAVFLIRPVVWIDCAARMDAVCRVPSARKVGGVLVLVDAQRSSVDHQCPKNRDCCECKRANVTKWRLDAAQARGWRSQRKKQLN